MTPDRGGPLGFGIIPLGEGTDEVDDVLARNPPTIVITEDGTPVTPHATHIITTGFVKIQEWERLPSDVSLLATPNWVSQITTGTRFHPFKDDGRWWGSDGRRLDTFTFEDEGDAREFAERFNRRAEKKVREELGEA